MTELTAYLAARAYPGRGIVLGRTGKGECLALYFIMGRSANSRNRVFEPTPDGIRTRAHDPRRMSDPALIIYHPVRRYDAGLIVTNGDQTDTLRDGLAGGLRFEEALSARTYEPDAPHYTSRVSGLYPFAGGGYSLSILRRRGEACERAFFAYAPAAPGQGHIVHTYAGDGDPLPAFSGDPAPVALPGGGLEAIAGAVWESLDVENRVALYAAAWEEGGTGFRMHIVNRHEAGAV